MVKTGIGTMTPIELAGYRFILGFERCYCAFKMWQDLLKNNRTKWWLYEYLQPFSWDRTDDDDN